MDRLDARLGFDALLLDQGEGASQVGGKVLGVREEVGEGGLNVGIRRRLATERAQVVDSGMRHGRGRHNGSSSSGAAVVLGDID